MRLLGVSGSMRGGSRGLMALQSVLRHAQGHGAEPRVLDMAVLDLPLFRPHAEIGPAAVAAAEAVSWAQAFIIVSPDYHGSMAGSVKNFFDYHWGQFAGKLFGYICTSHEKGLTVMDQMRTAVRNCYGWSLPYGLSINPDEEFGPDGTITSPELPRRMEMLGRDIVAYGKPINDQFERDRADPSIVSFAGRYR